MLGETPKHDSNSACLPESLEKESADHNNLIMIKYLKENYQVLTRKTLAMFKWSLENIDADFVVKMDDDSYLNLPLLAADLV